MLKCPRCGESSDTLEAYGVLVWGRVTVEFSSTGIPKATTPIIPQAMIKPGQEIQGKGFKLTCPHCNYDGHYSSYEIVIVCEITGSRADSALTVSIPSIAPFEVTYNSVIVDQESLSEYTRQLSSLFVRPEPCRLVLGQMANQTQRDYIATRREFQELSRRVSSSE